ncbi:hypothetical protein L7F22_005491 [Adiantum nelumboides]|nr:hypothetical protein [Adiantum nelumboides]
METNNIGKDSIEAAIAHVQTVSPQEVDQSMLEEEDEDSMFSSISDDSRVLNDEGFPLFVTYGKLLSMLHGTVAANLIKQQKCYINEQVHLEDKKKLTDYWTSDTMKANENAYVINAHETSSNNLEMSYSNLDEVAAQSKPISELAQLQICFGCRVVNYELFERYYWPKLSQSLRFTFDAVLVWSERMSLIEV